MARERIITLRHLSQESNGLSPQLVAIQADNTTRRQSRFQPSSIEPNTADGQDIEMLSSPTKQGQDSRTPVIVLEDHSAPAQDQSGDEKKKIIYRQSVPTKSDDEEDDRSTLEGDYDPLIKHSFGEGPIVSSDRFDSQSDKSRLSHRIEALDMGQFMNQVSKLSTRIDAMEIDLAENQPNFSNDSAFRSAIYQKIDQKVIQELIGLETTYRPKSTQSDHLHSRDDYGLDHGTVIEKRGPSTPEIEDSLKAEQINGLKSKAKSLLTGLIIRLTDEKQIIANQIEYEWTKELSGSSKSFRHSVATLADNDNIDYQLFSKLNQIEDDPRASKFYSDELPKILNLAVRSSTSYPEARKSSLFIKSNINLFLKMQDELHQLNESLRLLSPDDSRHSSDDEATEEDSSSVSFSLDGVEEADDKGPDSSSKKAPKIQSKTGDRAKKPKKTQIIADLESNSAPCHRLSYGPNLTHATPFHDDRSYFSRHRFAILCAVLASVLLACMAMVIYFNIKAHNK